MVAWHSSNTFRLINELTVRRAGLVLRMVTAALQAGKPSRYITNRLGQLSLPSFHGR